MYLQWSLQIDLHMAFDCHSRSQLIMVEYDSNPGLVITFYLTCKNNYINISAMFLQYILLQGCNCDEFWFDLPLMFIILKG